VFHGLTRRNIAATKLFCLAFSWRPLRLGGKFADQHSPPRRKERQEIRQAKIFPGGEGFSPMQSSRNQKKKADHFHVNVEVNVDVNVNVIGLCQAQILSRTARISGSGISLTISPAVQ
jgi:hypothetical protein